MTGGGLKMERFPLGVTRMDEIRNECFGGSAQVEGFGDKVREARLRWFEDAAASSDS